MLMCSVLETKLACMEVHVLGNVAYIQQALNLHTLLVLVVQRNGSPYVLPSIDLLLDNDISFMLTI